MPLSLSHDCDAFQPKLPPINHLEAVVVPAAPVLSFSLSLRATQRPATIRGSLSHVPVGHVSTTLTRERASRRVVRFRLLQCSRDCRSLPYSSLPFTILFFAPPLPLPPQPRSQDASFFLDGETATIDVWKVRVRAWASFWDCLICSRVSKLGTIVMERLSYPYLTNEQMRLGKNLCKMS